MTSHRARLEAVLAGEKPDRVPVALWRHFPVDDQNPHTLAAAHLAFQRTFDFDLLKVTPASSFCLKDWGAQDEWRGATEGTRTYTRRVIQAPEDWAHLPVLEPTAGHLGDHLKCLRIIVQELAKQAPVIQTIFSPLSQAKNLVGADTLIIHLRRYPQAVHAGLRTIAESTRRYVEAARQVGIDGIFYAVQHAQYGLLSEAEYEAFSEPYDLQILEPAQKMWLNMLHLHGIEVMFDRLAGYPVQIINWHDRETSPSIQAGQAAFPGTVCGGIRREETMVLGSPEQIRQEAREAIQLTQGRRFILSTGCVIPITTPYGSIRAVRRIVEEVLPT